MFWKPAMTGCGANLINAPSFIRPNSAWKMPPSRMMAKKISSVSDRLADCMIAVSECRSEYSHNPMKKVVKTPTVYAPRVTTTFFIGLLLYSLLYSDTAIMQSASLPLTLLIFFAIILLGGIFQALFGLMKLGALIKFAPHPVMAGFQNMAALLLFLVQRPGQVPPRPSGSLPVTGLSLAYEYAFKG